jgi:endogenous inhibitor of DNA gyrase (YacG/DUF329 family)
MKGIMATVSCPICGQAMDVQDLSAWPQFPFCSARCKTIDLGRWLSERYAIPREDSGEPEPEGPEEEEG